MLVLLLKEIAKDKGIYQEEIARNLDMAQGDVARFFSCRFRPNLDLFLQIANQIGVNFFFEDRDSITDLNSAFERAMEQLGRRPDKLSKN